MASISFAILLTAVLMGAAAKQVGADKGRVINHGDIVYFSYRDVPNSAMCCRNGLCVATLRKNVSVKCNTSFRSDHYIYLTSE